MERFCNGGEKKIAKSEYRGVKWRSYLISRLASFLCYSISNQQKRELYTVFEFVRRKFIFELDRLPIFFSFLAFRYFVRWFGVVNKYVPYPTLLHSAFSLV